MRQILEFLQSKAVTEYSKNALFTQEKLCCHNPSGSVLTYCSSCPAQILNFSIAYGKTAHGLAKDWGVTIDEAQETVDRWYSDRPEVRKLLHEQKHCLLCNGFLGTLHAEILSSREVSHANVLSGCELWRSIVQ